VVPLPDPLAVALRVAAILDDLGVPYLVGGSVASSLLGEVRSTIDVDLVADLSEQHVKPLVAALEGDFYVAESAVRDAVARRSMFNVIHLATSTKADIYVLPATPIAREEMRRRQLETVSAETGDALFIASPEDVVLQKLDWYRLGREISDRQWRDVLGVLKTQRERLDYSYLRRWAAEMNLIDLLERAFREAGLENAGS
jgi:hypothetical protein